MGVTGLLAEDSPLSAGPIGILDHVFKKLIRYKMLNQARMFFHAKKLLFRRC